MHAGRRSGHADGGVSADHRKVFYFVGWQNPHCRAAWALRKYFAQADKSEHALSEFCYECAWPEPGSRGRQMASELSDDQRRNFLRDEYLLLQSQYEDYDRRSLTIKSWISSGATAALAISFSTSHHYAMFVPIIVAVMVIVTWYLEAYWKMFQYALADRIRMIEAFFRNDQKILINDNNPFQIYHWWFESYSKDAPLYEYERARKLRPRRRSERFRKVAFQRFVCLPYLPILVLCGLSLIVLAFPQHAS
jgi:hypothetical protein